VAIMPNEEHKSGAQKAAEAEVESFRKDLGPFVVAAETTRMAMVFTDAKESGNPIIFANDSFLSLTGHDREGVLGRSFNFLMAPCADPEALAEIEAAFEGSSDSDPEIRYRRKDGSVFWASIYISPVRDEGGDVVQHFASFVDLTKHKQEKDRLRFLLDELNHRTPPCRQLPCRPCAVWRTRKWLMPSRGAFWRCQRPIPCWGARTGTGWACAT
jgi:PAS domain S-box-containing protein